MLQRSHQLPNWATLVTAIEQQFGPSIYDSPRIRLFKLVQSTTVTQYYTEFMTLANRSEGLSPEALCDCFISGLKDYIRREVLARSPLTLLQAVSLSRLYDEKSAMGLGSSFAKPSSCSLPTKPLSLASARVSPSTITKAQLPVPLPPLLPTPTTVSPSSSRRMTPVEIQMRREKGLCFTCDAKYSASHQCPNKRLMLLLAENDDPPE